MTLAKASLTRGYPRSFETAEQVARSVASLALYGLPDTYFEEFVPKVDAVTVDDVVRVANRYIDPARLTTLIVGDYEKVGAFTRCAWARRLGVAAGRSVIGGGRALRTGPARAQQSIHRTSSKMSLCLSGFCLA